MGKNQWVPIRLWHRIGLLYAEQYLMTMKILKSFVLFLTLMALTANAQEKTAKFQQFNNFSAEFQVPEGKTWMISSIFSNAIGELVQNADGSTTTLPVRIFIKTFNGDIKTDYEGDRYGPQVYQSDNTSATMSYPITLPENTKFSLVIVVGNPGNFKMFNGIGFMSYFEITNNEF